MSLKWITADDVVRVGACREGVEEWVARNAPEATAIPVDAALRMSRDEDFMWVERAAGLIGYGDYGYGCYGYGDYGYGDDGYGDGGDGFGDGLGFEYGDGYGYGGYGFGDGFCYGGDGYGFGDGFCYGGDGYGFGYGGDGKGCHVEDECNE